jgi:hypothetical protein
MRIVHADLIEEKIRIQGPRRGMFRHRTLAAGEPGTAGNFTLELVRTCDDFFAPRRKDNFDQFRYQLEGEFDFDRNGKMVPSTIGYFPEGTPYGPQRATVSSLTLVLQFGGASGSGYMMQEQLRSGAAEPEQHGRAEKGMFRRTDQTVVKHPDESCQEAWDNANPPTKYPPPRYHDPIIMAPEHFDWVPVEGAPGVCEKLVGVFTERACEARFLRLAPPARLPAPGRKLYFVLHGEGRAGAHAYRHHSTVFCERGEQIRFVADTPTEMLVLGLPKLDRPTHYPAAAQPPRAAHELREKYQLNAGHDVPLFPVPEPRG